MDFKDCLKFASDKPVSFVASMEGGQPRVRAFLMWFSDEGGFYYHTVMAKNVYKQLKNNPNVDVCFYHSGGDMLARNMREAEIPQIKF